MSAHSINIPESPYVCFDNGGATYEITDCIGDKFTGDTIDEAIRNLANTYRAPPDTEHYYVKICLHCNVFSDAIISRVRELIAERKAKEETAKLRQSQEFYDILLGAWQKEVDALNADAGDYTPEGFNKRWQTLQAKKPVKPC